MHTYIAYTEVYVIVFGMVRDSGYRGPDAYRWSTNRPNLCTVV